ncbi:MAG: hypothetical protein ABJG88_03280 [Litorimonas sp.]
MASVNDILTQALTDKVIDPTEFSQLRRKIFGDGHVSLQEANMIFLFDMQAQSLPEGWSDFFVGAITDFLIRQTLPAGYVDSIHSAWLMERIEHDDQMKEDTEMKLLLNVLRLAVDVPRDLEIYALNKVRDKIISSGLNGQLSIQTEDVELLKRVLYASSGSGGFSICREEAQFLFQLDEICQNSVNAPEWQKLFVGAIANHVMTMGAPKMLDRETMKDLQEKPLKMDWSLSGIKNSFLAWESDYKNEEQSFFLNETAMQQAEAITAVEADWLVKHLNRDGVLSSNERALLKFIKEECANVHKTLAPLLRHAA